MLIQRKKLLFFVLLICSRSYAENNQTQLLLSPSLFHFDYTEFNTFGETLDRELGWLPGIEVKLDHRFDEDWKLQLQVASYHGTVDYDGQTQQGSPHTTETRTELTRFAARIERSLSTSTALFAGIIRHRWDRDIKDQNNVVGITEIYRWTEYNIGLNLKLSSRKNASIDVDIAYLTTRNNTINVDLSRADAGSATLDIGDGSGGRINLNWKSNQGAAIRFGASIFVEGWDFGRSNTKPTQGGSTVAFITEPRSETRNIGLQLNLHYSL